MNQGARQRRRNILLFAIVVVAIWLPRGLALDRFVTIDERAWLRRSGNFYRALAHGDFADTFQAHHPGVTITWAGTAGFLWRHPAYAHEAPSQFDPSEGIVRFRELRGYDPLKLLTAGRIFVVLGNTVVLLAAFFAARRLLGLLPALIGSLFIAFDPFHVSLTRLLHLDGLMSSVVLLALLAFLNYLYGERRRLYLVVSAVAAGSGWLTKSPALFLAPFIGLLVLNQLWRDWRIQRRLHVSDLWRSAWPLILWAGLGVAIFVLLWPAMWVDPMGSLTRVFAAATNYAEGGHGHNTFFDGAVIEEDPGLYFYPVTYLWRTTPVVLVGLGLAVVAFALRRAPLAGQKQRRTATALVLFAVLYTSFMTSGAKKFDRYLLPVYAPLDLVAAIGWVAAAHSLEGRGSPKLSRLGAPVLLGTVLLVQTLGVVRTFPYYLSYYNPLLGASVKAREVMMIGWGEGMDQAARYLNAKPDAEQMRVMAWYRGGPFSYIFEGRTVRMDTSLDGQKLREMLSSDYVVLYIHQWQRQLPSQKVLDFFARQTPEHVIRINGLEYAQIYNMHEVQHLDDLFDNAYLNVGRPPAVDWGGVVRLAAYELPEKPVMPGQDVSVTCYLQDLLAPISRDLNVRVRLVGEDGRELVHDEGWPAGTTTSTWRPHDVWISKHDFTIPADMPSGFYRVELSLYDAATLTPLPATDPHTGEFLGNAWVVDHLVVGGLPAVPARPLVPPAEVGQQIRLLGADVLMSDAELLAPDTNTMRPGEPLRAVLFWQAQAPITTNYTVFVHLVGPDGRLVAQQDNQPKRSSSPTSSWQSGQVVADDYKLRIPHDAPPGVYELRVGMYELTTLQRLPVSRADQQAGDYVSIATVPVTPSSVSNSTGSK